jgi:hypothetical protein
MRGQFDPDLSLRTLRLALPKYGRRLGNKGIGLPEAHCLPLYLLNDRDAVRAQPLRRAQLAAVVFPIIENRVPAIATINLKLSGYTYGGISHGPIPQLIHNALFFAEKAVGSRRQAYKPLILQSISLQFVLLVLRPERGRTLFLPLLLQSPTEPSEFRLRSGLVNFLATAHLLRYTPAYPKSLP